MKEFNNITMTEDAAFELLKSKKEDEFDVVKGKYDTRKAELEAKPCGSEEQKKRVDQEIKTLTDAWKIVEKFYQQPDYSGGKGGNGGLIVPTETLFSRFKKYWVAFSLIILVFFTILILIRACDSPGNQKDPIVPIDSTDSIVKPVFNSNLLVQLLNTPPEKRSGAWKDSLKSLVPDAELCAFYVNDVRMGTFAEVINRMENPNWPFSGLLSFGKYDKGQDKKESFLVMKYSNTGNVDKNYEIVEGVTIGFVENQIEDLVTRFVDGVSKLSAMAMDVSKSNYKTIQDWEKACENVKDDVYKLFISKTVSIETISNRGSAPVSKPLNTYLSDILKKSDISNSIIQITVEEATKYEIRQLKTLPDNSIVGLVDVLFSYKRFRPETNNRAGDVPSLAVEYSDMTLKTLEIHLERDHFATSDGSKEGYRVCLGEIKASEMFNSNLEE
jgi:hypothetical protein